MVSTDYTYYELYFSNRRLPTPELNGFYQCKGAFIDREDGRRVFAVESIKKLERGSKELEEKIPQEDYSEVQKLLHNSADVSSLFSFKELFNHPLNGLLCPEIVNNETVHDLNASEETITNEPDLNCTLKQDNYYPNSKENEPLKVENNEIVPAIILSIDNLKNIAMLFVPGRNTPFVKVPLKFLEAPFKIGQFYSIKLPNVKQSKYTSIYYNNFAKIWKETPPIKTRISSGTIQFHICALLDKRTENGFSCFKSKNFPLVIDSSCLFNHYNINGKMSIKKVKFWCSLRKIPIAGIYWKIVKIDKKFKKEIISFIDERQNEEEKLKRKKEEEVKKKEEIKKKLEKEKIQQIIKQQQQQKTIKEKIAKNENECFNGFVCAQLLNEYIIYLPEEKEYAYLLIKSKMDKLLGLWLQIQIRYLNEKLMVERFFVVESKILSIVSNKRAMFKSKIEIPSLNDPTETLPFCTTLGIYLNDNHNLIQNKHRGRCVNGTIGVKPLENEESLIQWEILHIMEH